MGSTSNYTTIAGAALLFSQFTHRRFIDIFLLGLCRLWELVDNQRSYVLRSHVINATYKKDTQKMVFQNCTLVVALRMG